MRTIAKAIVAGLLAGATGIVAPTFGHPWSWWQLLPAGVAGLATFSGVYFINDGREIPTPTPAPTPIPPA